MRNEINREILKNAMITNAVLKGKLLESDECYVVDTIMGQLNKHGVQTEENHVKYDILNNYIGKINFVDLDCEVNIFDFMMELLVNLSVFEQEVTLKYADENANFEKMNIEVLEKYAEKGNDKARKYDLVTFQ